MSLSKGYIATLKGKKVRFQVVSYNGDIKVQFVNSCPDFNVKVAPSPSCITETIRIQVVDHSADVKLQKVTTSGDFEAYFQ